MLKVILGFYMVCVGSSTVLAMVFTEHETQKFSAVPCRGVTVLSVLKEVQPRLNHDVVEALLKKDPSKLCDAARALVRQLKETHNAKMKEEQRKAIAAARMEREEGAAAAAPRGLKRGRSYDADAKGATGSKRLRSDGKEADAAAAPAPRTRSEKQAHNAKMKEEQRKAIAAAGMEREEGAAAGPSPRHLGRDAHMAKMQKEQQEANAAARSQKEADDQE